LVVEEVEVEVAEEAGGWFELDAVLFGSFGGWMSARGLSCHCFVDSCPMSVCFGLSGTFGG